MNEELMNYDENENMEVCGNYDDTEASGGGIFGKVLLGLAAVGVGAAVLYHKNKDKIDERRIRKLEKKGYQVTKLEAPVVQVVNGETIVSCESEK